MHTTKHTCWLFILFSCLMLVKTEGAITGTFKSLGYDIEFQSHSWGELKEISFDSSEVTITSSNTFSMVVQGGYINRIIEDLFVPGTENRFLNQYWVNHDSDNGTEGGEIEEGPNMTFEVGNGTPVCFGASTNIALLINPECEVDESDNELGMSVLLRKGEGMNNSSIAGTYIRYSLGNTFHGNTPHGWGSMDRISLDSSTFVFDGAGLYTDTGIHWGIDRETIDRVITNGTDTLTDSFCILSDPNEESYSTNGTYSVAPDGTLAISSEMGFITNQVCSDANTIGSSLSFFSEDAYASCYFTFMVKQPSNMSTQAIDAVYYIAILSEEFYKGFATDSVSNNEVDLERIYVFLKSDGTLSMRTDHWKTCNTLNNVWSDNDLGPGVNLVSKNQVTTSIHERTIALDHAATYSIETNGVITLHFSNGDTGQGQLSENGEVLIVGYAYGDDDEAERAIGFGIRRTPPAPATTPVVFQNDMTFSATGMVMTATLPINYPVEGLYCSDLTENEWYSDGSYTSATGTVEIHDPSATNAVSRFYSATFMPW